MRRSSLAKDPGTVGVHRELAERVLPARLTVHDEAEVLEEVSALGRLVETDGARRFGHPLTLVAPRLRVLLDGHRAPVGHLANHRHRVAGIVILVRAAPVAAGGV